MEHTAAWAGPYELQLAMNWTAEEAPADDAQVWAPAAGHSYPLQYASIADIFGSSCSLQPYVVPASGGQQQPVEYNYYAAAAQHHDPTTGKGTTTQEEDLSPLEEQMEPYMNNPKKLFRERKDEFKADAKLMKTKMHRYPPSIRDLGDWCTVPKVVAIGPYHRHHDDKLKQAEEIKHVAAYHCIEESGRPVEEMYAAVISAARDSRARDLYHKDVMAGTGDGDFLPMMFYDACFLVMYMLNKQGTRCEEDLCHFFETNDDDIYHDILLLENQIPWPVVDAIMEKCTPEPLEKKERFIAIWKNSRGLQDQVDKELPRVHWDEEPPHLLGLRRHHIVGKRSISSSSRRQIKPSSKSEKERIDSIPISASAMELAGMGIFLTADQTIGLPDVGLAKKWTFFGKLAVPPLSLDDQRASMLVNMAALELCTTPYFLGDKVRRREDSAVCSYLRVLSMLAHREEDVHELRTKGILQGAGLTNKNALDFFTSVKSLREGAFYSRVMVQIADYRRKKPWVIKGYGFGYKNRKTIGWFVSALVGFVTIILAVKRAL